MRVDEFIVCRAGRNYDGGFLRACRLSIARVADFATQNRTHRCSLEALIVGGSLCEDVVHLVSSSLSLKVQTSRASCCPSSWGGLNLPNPATMPHHKKTVDCAGGSLRASK
jgi:hypothetical protein